MKPDPANADLWLNAGSLAANHKDRDPIVTWTDSSGNHRDAVQPINFEPPCVNAGYPKPTYDAPLFWAQVEGIKNQPAVSFSTPGKLQQTLTLNQAGRTLDKGVAAFTVILVLRTDPIPDPDGHPDQNASCIFATHTPDAAIRFAITRTWDNLTTDLEVRPNDLDASETAMNITHNPVPVPADWGILTFSVNYASRVYDQYWNKKKNKRDSLPGNTPAAVSMISSSVVAIGSNTCTQFMRGDIAEIICFRRELSPADFNTWHDYLLSKYGFS